MYRYGPDWMTTWSGDVRRVREYDWPNALIDQIRMPRPAAWMVSPRGPDPGGRAQPAPAQQRGQKGGHQVPGNDGPSGVLVLCRRVQRGGGSRFSHGGLDDQEPGHSGYPARAIPPPRAPVPSNEPMSVLRHRHAGPVRPGR